MPPARANVTTAKAPSQQATTDLAQPRNITLNTSRGRDVFAFGKHTQSSKFLISFLQQFGDWNLRNSLQIPAQGFAEVRGGRIIIAMRAALRLADNFVHDLQFQKILRS